jgi:mono/diheme cytochrome c family protein
MRKVSYVLSGFLLAAALTVFTSVSEATVAIAKKEGGAKCVVCHTKGKELNKVGECYKASKSLKDCQEKENK